MSKEVVGYIVVAINFIDGSSGFYTIECNPIPPGGRRPTPGQMHRMVRRSEDDGDSLLFLGRQLGMMQTDEDCWFAVPAAGYLSASWQFYTKQEFDEVATKREEVQKEAESKLDINYLFGTPSATAHAEGPYH